MYFRVGCYTELVILPLFLQLSTSEADALSIALQGQFVPAWILP